MFFFQMLFRLPYPPPSPPLLFFFLMLFRLAWLGPPLALVSLVVGVARKHGSWTIAVTVGGLFGAYLLVMLCLWACLACTRFRAYRRYVSRHGGTPALPSAGFGANGLAGGDDQTAVIAPVEVAIDVQMTCVEIAPGIAQSTPERLESDAA